MILSKKTLEKLRDLINEETEYRSGPKLVSFFNQLGFNDIYKQGFPSRWIYTDEKLTKLNGFPELDKCIKTLLSPANFIGRITELDKIIDDFNKFISFDGWIVTRRSKEISFKRVDENYFESVQDKEDESIDDFLQKSFEEISIEGLNIDIFVYSILDNRIQELQKCLKVDAPLAVIFHAGSILEGLLLGIAQKNPRDFNTSSASPRNSEGAVKAFHEWTLNNYIEVAYSLNYLHEDVKKFSHALREFRNYIHPYQQASSKFSPDENTARICFQVLKAAIAQIRKKIN